MTGPPETMEAYVQQVGRAGRDGLPAQCLLLYSDVDFTSYKSDFYMKTRSPAVQEAVGKSTAFLQVSVLIPIFVNPCLLAAILSTLCSITPIFFPFLSLS